MSHKDSNSTSVEPSKNWGESLPNEARYSAYQTKDETWSCGVCGWSEDDMLAMKDDELGTTKLGTTEQASDLLVVANKLNKWSTVTEEWSLSLLRCHILVVAINASIVAILVPFSISITVPILLGSIDLGV